MAAVLLMLGAVASTAHAQEAGVPPDELLRRGLLAIESQHPAEGRQLLDQACPLLAKSQHDDPRPVTLYNLALCEQGRDRYATAATLYDEYFAILDRLSGDERRLEVTRQGDAARRRQAIEPFIPTVLLTLPLDAPVSTRVLRYPADGSPPVRMAAGVPLRLDPGEHVVSTQVSDGPRVDTKFAVKKGEHNVKVTLNWAIGDTSSKMVQPGRLTGPVEAALPPLDPPPTAWRISAYTTGAIGIAGLVLGVVSGVVTLVQKSRIESNCEPNPMVGPSQAVLPQVCNPTGESGANTAKTWGSVSTPAFVAGGGLLALGIILYFTEPKSPRLQQDAAQRMRRMQRMPTFGVTAADTHGASMGLTVPF